MNDQIAYNKILKCKAKLAQEDILPELYVRDFIR